MADQSDQPTVNVSVAFAMAHKQFWRNLKVPRGATVGDAIERSGVLDEFPKIDLDVNKVGIFGEIAALDTVVSDGDRVEIYRPIIIDPLKLPKKKYRLRKVEPVVETKGRVTTIAEPANQVRIEQEGATMSLSGMLSEYGFIVKVDVTDLNRSLAWYQDKLGFKVDERYSAGSWRQLTLEDLPNTALGLYLNPDGAGLGGKRATFVVRDIEEVRNRLLRAGVEVDEIAMLGDWVKLAFLRDPDGNIFGIRENIVGGGGA